ncbi:hypothetical protein FOA52_013068 [Chlamydomonas sp. UWO 241]|nr:hypothetical protein FOA52_013068 [Chlamydomonas sp. UWO 241]
MRHPRISSTRSAWPYASTRTVAVACTLGLVSSVGAARASSPMLRSYVFFPCERIAVFNAVIWGRPARLPHSRRSAAPVNESAVGLHNIHQLLLHQGLCDDPQPPLVL